MISIRAERPEDHAAVRRLNREAFDGPAEARIVDALRERCEQILSLVAVDPDEGDPEDGGPEGGGAVVGHILFSPVSVDPDSPGAPAGRTAPPGMGLAPMAVLPGRQRRGIGTALVERGLAMLRRKSAGREPSCAFVVVLGHPDYYPRFGFRPASGFGLRSPWEGVPDEAFMALELHPGALDGVRGVVRYRDEFEDAAAGA